MRRAAVGFLPLVGRLDESLIGIEAPDPFFFAKYASLRLESLRSLLGVFFALSFFSSGFRELCQDGRLDSFKIILVILLFISTFTEIFECFLMTFKISTNASVDMVT